MAPSKNDLINQASDLSVKLQIAIDGLLELRNEVTSGSLEMGIIDETLSKIPVSPFATDLPVDIDLIEGVR